MIKELNDNTNLTLWNTKSDLRADGYIRIAAAAPDVHLGNVDANVKAILKSCTKALSKGADIILTPELSLTGYTCADLFFQHKLLNEAMQGLIALASSEIAAMTTIVVGLPMEYCGAIYNCAAVVDVGKIVAIVPKTYIPNYGEFYEKRWFASGKNIPLRTTVKIDGYEIPFGTDILLRKYEALVGVEICEDLWVPAPPSVEMALAGASVILNLSATNEVAGKHEYLRSLIMQQSARLRCAYIYASAASGESSTDLVFTGNAIIAENGHILSESKRFENAPLLKIADVDIQLLTADRMHATTFADTASNANAIGKYRIVKLSHSLEMKGVSNVMRLLRKLNPMPFVPASDSHRDQRCREIINIQTEGLRRRIAHLGNARLVVGISGGLDSTLALLVAVNAIDRQRLPRTNITGITMPGFGTTHRTKTNADRLMECLGVQPLEIPIARAAAGHLEDIGHSLDMHDITYENAQARERTQVLMDYANKIGGIVIGTGDLSELALGWCTYNGDQMSMYGVNASIPKTLVRWLVRWFADTASSTTLASTLYDILDTPVSPELIPASEDGSISQKTEEIVGPYELHDFFLYNLLRHGYAPEKIARLACAAFEDEFDSLTIEKWLRVFLKRFYSQQFKRSCMPDGPKVGTICLSPRGDWRMPSDF